jgi:integrase/recombinase XerC/integrase/recombinase XerD
VRDLESYTKEWLLDGEIAQHSSKTLANRKIYLKNLLWFLKHRGYETVGTQELKQFMRYFHQGHTEEGGRWGNPQEKTPVKPSTVATYHRHIRAFFRWLVDNDYLTDSPMEKVPVPIDRPDEIQTFTDEQIQALLRVAQKSSTPLRDRALLLILLDTGMRLSELCNLQKKDIDLLRGTGQVMGKGNKARTFYIGRKATQALRDYLRREEREETDCLFFSKRGEPLTQTGVQQLIDRFGEVAEIAGVRCSPHTFRHTFAVKFIRGGGCQFALQKLLGHTDLRMTSRYVALAEADLEQQHRAYSPVDSMKQIPLKSRR